MNRNLLTGNPIWMMRTKGVARMTAERCHRAGGERAYAARSGVDIDLRRDMPYSGMRILSFKVRWHRRAMFLHAIVCRVAELREIEQELCAALDGMPEGPIKANAPGVVLPDRRKMKSRWKRLIYHFKIITEDLACRAGEYIRRWSRHRGDGILHRSDGTAKPYRVHMRAAGLAESADAAQNVRGGLIADVVARSEHRYRIRRIDR